MGIERSSRPDGRIFSMGQIKVGMPRLLNEQGPWLGRAEWKVVLKPE